LRRTGPTSSWSTSDGSPTAASTPSPWSSAGRSSDMSLTVGRSCSRRSGSGRGESVAETLASVTGDIDGLPMHPCSGTHLAHAAKTTYPTQREQRVRKRLHTRVGYHFIHLDLFTLPPTEPVCLWCFPPVSQCTRHRYLLCAPPDSQ